MESFLTNHADQILELGIKLFGLIITIIGTFAVAKLPGKWGKEAHEALLTAEEKLRGSLHTAARSGLEAGRKEGYTGDELVVFALKHIISSVPDALAGLAPSAKDIVKSGPVDLVLSRLPAPLRKVLTNIVVSYM